MARSRYKVIADWQPHFLTCTIVGWLPIFTRPEAAQIVLDSLAFLQAHERLTLYGYVIMVNHLHLIASSEDLPKEMGDFKSFTARQIIDHLIDKGEQRVLRQLKHYKMPHRIDRPYQLWQEGSHPQLIQSDEMMRQKLEYMHNNPVKSGLVDGPLHWRYSSARNYAGEEGLINVTTVW